MGLCECYCRDYTSSEERRRRLPPPPPPPRLKFFQVDIKNAFGQFFHYKGSDKWSATPATLLYHASHTFEASEVSISIEAVLATLRAFDPEMLSISCTNIPYILSQYNLTSKLLSSGPAEAAHVGGGAPFTP